VVARVTLSRPEKRNAFDASLIAELRSTFAALERDSATDLRAVVLAGAGETFSAGADIDWMRAAMQLDVEGNEQDAMAMAEMFEAIDTCPVPVIARVQGAALGGGMGLCAVSDLVIAESGARFGFTETRLGILPAVISPFVLAKIGSGAARRYFLTGERFGPDVALRIGLVNEIAPNAEATVQELLTSGPSAARAAKSLVRPHPGDGRELAELAARMRTSDEGQDGLRAFLERRKPGWTD
jgi:methylglutaconyl-CoA hydratase